jgi:cell wall-associated NlpC family hydrolase
MREHRLKVAGLLMTGQLMTQVRGDDPNSNSALESRTRTSNSQLVNQQLPEADTTELPTNTASSDSLFLAQVDSKTAGNPVAPVPKPTLTIQQKVDGLLKGGFISQELAEHVMTKTSSEGFGLMQKVSAGVVDQLVSVLDGLKEKGLTAEHIKALVTMGFGKGGIAGALDYIKKFGELTFDQLKARFAAEDRHSILWLSENSVLLDKSLREIAPVEKWLKEEREKQAEQQRVLEALQREEERKKNETTENFSSGMYQAVSSSTSAFGNLGISKAAMAVLQSAAKYNGYVEGAGNRTKFGAAFGADGQPWCGSFVNYVFKSVGVDIPRVVYTPDGAQSFKDMNRWASRAVSPQAGWVVFFDWQNDGQIDHVGIVVGVNSDGSVKTIEGNTSPSNQSNGGQVMVRNRSLTNIAGYGVPKAYDSNAPRAVLA